MHAHSSMRGGPTNASLRQVGFNATGSGKAGQGVSSSHWAPGGGGAADILKALQPNVLPAELDSLLLGGWVRGQAWARACEAGVAVARAVADEVLNLDIEALIRAITPWYEPMMRSRRLQSWRSSGDRLDVLCFDGNAKLYRRSCGAPCAETRFVPSLDLHLVRGCPESPQQRGVLCPRHAALRTRTDWQRRYVSTGWCNRCHRLHSSSWRCRWPDSRRDGSRRAPCQRKPFRLISPSTEETSLRLGTRSALRSETRGADVPGCLEIGPLSLRRPSVRARRTRNRLQLSEPPAGQPAFCWL